MKKFTKLTALVLSLAMTVASFAACGDGNTSASDNSVVASTDSNGETVAATGATFKIGGIGPTTGGAAIYGIAVERGAKIAIDEINAAGGINGYMIEYKYEDDECDAEKSVNAYNALKDWGMQMLVGTTTSGCCVAVAAESVNDNMFQITPSGSSVDCIKNDNVFQVCFTDPNQGIGSAQYIGQNGLATKVAVIYDSSDVYSSGIYTKFAAEAENQPFEIVATEAFTADSKTDFSVQLQKAADAGAELVFLPFYYTEASLVLTQAAAAGYDFTFFGCDGLDGILGVENFDIALAEGVMLLTPFAADAQDAATQAFVSTYESLYGELPNQFAADAYDAVYAIKAAAEKANVNPNMSISEIGDAMKVAITEVSVDGLTGEAMHWDAEGTVNKAPKAMIIKDGTYSLIQ